MSSFSSSVSNEINGCCIEFIESYIIINWYPCPYNYIVVYISVGFHLVVGMMITPPPYIVCR